MEQPQGMNQINQIGLMFIKQALEHDMSNPGEKKERGEARALKEKKKWENTAAQTDFFKNRKI